MIALTFALSDESRDVLARLHREPGVASRRQRVATGTFAGVPVTILHTGVGAAAACRARLTALLARPQRPDAVIASGYAGGLHADLRAGDLVLDENVSDPKLTSLARAVLTGCRLHVGAITTQPRTIESTADKAALASATGAIAVDMETGWIAEACRAAGVPLLALRVISDDAHTDFPVPAAIMFDQVKQRPRVVALPLWLLAHPGHIAPFVRFVRGLAPARRRLTDALEKVVSKMTNDK